MSTANQNIYQLIKSFSNNEVASLIWYHWIMHTATTRLLPYHNNQHCERVAKRAIAYARQDGLDEADQLELFAAALWHDARYVGTETDATNVPRSVEAWTSAVTELGLRAQFVSAVSQLIASTYYPYVDNQVFDPTNRQHVCLRDADLGESTEEDGVDIIHCLYRELHAAHKFTGTWQEFRVAQTAFQRAAVEQLVSPQRRPVFQQAFDRWLASV